MLFFLKTDSSRNLEFFSTMQAIGACLGGYFFEVYPGGINKWFLINAFLCCLQFYALASRNIKKRHWTNVVSTCTTCIVFVFLLSHLPKSGLDVFGYLFLILMQMYCIYATDRDIKILERQR